jgi:hypothetical protein
MKKDGLNQVSLLLSFPGRKENFDFSREFVFLDKKNSPHLPDFGLEARRQIPGGSHMKV